MSKFTFNFYILKIPRKPPRPNVIKMLILSIELKKSHVTSKMNVDTESEFFP